MKAVILAGGLGTRISEETGVRPKPMVEIGGHPILWHVMKILYHQGIDEFIVCAGYRQYMIKEYFADYFLHCSDVTFDFKDGSSTIVHNTNIEKWKVTVVDTGLNTMTGGRLKRIKEYLGDDDFLMTYGDGVSDVNIAKLLDFHKQHGKMVTVTAVHPVGRFGILGIDGDTVTSFGEKIESDIDWINGGFMIVNPKALDRIDGDETTFEYAPMIGLSNEGQLMAYRHEGFWQCMDTVKDKKLLEDLWESGKAPWKIWDRDDRLQR